MQSPEIILNTSLQEPFYIQTTSGKYLTVINNKITAEPIAGIKTAFILRRVDRYNYILVDVATDQKIYDNVKIFLHTKSNEYPYCEIMAGNSYLSTNNDFGLDKFPSHATKFFLTFV